MGPPHAKGMLKGAFKGTHVDILEEILFSQQPWDPSSGRLWEPVSGEGATKPESHVLGEGPRIFRDMIASPFPIFLHMLPTSQLRVRTRQFSEGAAS